MAKNKYYAVVVGRVPGIYTTWAETQKQINGFKGQKYKSFENRMEAIEWAQQNGMKFEGELSRNDSVAQKEAESQIQNPLDNKPMFLEKETKISKSKTKAITLPETLVIYTDGSCLDNAQKTESGMYLGPGGYAAVILDGRGENELVRLTGGAQRTTNDRMEFTAVREALKYLDDGTRHQVTIVADNKYVIDTLEHYVRGWKKKEVVDDIVLIKGDGKPAANQALVKSTVRLRQKQRVNFEWVKGHSGAKYNELCDVLAKNEARIQAKIHDLKIPKLTPDKASPEIQDVKTTTVKEKNVTNTPKELPQEKNISPIIPSKTKLQRNNIPKELRERKQWICWKYEQLPGRSKPTKIPYNPETGYKAKSTDKSTWVDFETASRFSDQYDGIGFVFSREDPYVGIDLDHVLDKDSKFLYDDAKNLYERCESYTEISPSGTGLHIIAKAELTEGAAHRVEEIPGKECEKEIYDSGRYFTVTGNRMGDTQTIEDIQMIAEDLEEQIARQSYELKGKTKSGKENPAKNLQNASNSKTEEFTRKAFPELTEEKAFAKRNRAVGQALKEIEITEVTKGENLTIDYLRNGKKCQAEIPNNGIGFHIPTESQEKKEYMYAKLLRHLAEEKQLDSEKVPNLETMYPATKALVELTEKSGKVQTFVGEKEFSNYKLSAEEAQKQLEADMHDYPDLASKITRISAQKEGKTIKGLLISADFGSLFQRDESREQTIQNNRPEHLDDRLFRPVIQDAYICGQEKASFRWLKDHGTQCIVLKPEEIDGKNIQTSALENISLENTKFKGAEIHMCDVDGLTVGKEADLSKVVIDRCRFSSSEEFGHLVERGAEIQNCSVRMKDPEVKTREYSWNLVNAKNGKITDKRLDQLIMRDIRSKTKSKNTQQLER